MYLQRQRILRPIVFLAAALLATWRVPAPVAAQEPADTALAAAAPLDAPLPVDPAVRVGTLDNGTRFYIRHNERPEKRAEIRLVVNAGSVLEDDDQRGLAHFVEHMAFNGTEHFEKQELVDYLESIGMRFGPDINAFTSFDETIYMLHVPTDSARVVEKAFQILEDWADGLSFDSVEVEKERGVVLEEWRLGQGAEARVRDEQFPVLFHGSRYAERLPIGEPDVIENAPRGAMVRFYRDWYRPDMMAVIAVGDFDAGRIEELVREHFEGLRAPAHPRPRPAFDVPPNEQTLYAIASDPELSVSRVSVVWKQPPEEDRTHADYRRSFVESLYNSILNFRFFEITQSTEDPPFLFAGSGKGRLVRSSDAYQLSAAVKEGEVERGLERVLVEADRVRRYGFTSAELERQKADVLRAYERAFAEREKTESASYAAEYSRAFLVNEPFPGIAYEYALARRFLPEIGLEEVNRVGQEWIGDRDRVILAAVAEKEGVPAPTREQLAAAFEAARAADVEPYAEEAVETPLLAELPEPGTVVAETEVESVGVTEWRLSNGIRVLLKPTDFKEDQVLFTARSPGGTSLAPDSTYLSATWAATLVSVGGVGEWSTVDLQKRLAGKVVSVGPTIGELDEGMNGSASPKDLETMFQLVYLYFTAPRKDEVASESFRSRLATVLRNRTQDPDAVYADSLSVILSQNHFRRRPPTVEMLDEIDLDAALGFYRDRFADAGDFTFTFVGNFDLERIRPLVERYLASLPSVGRTETWRDVGVRMPGGVVRRTVRKGIEPKASTTIVFGGEFEFERVNRYQLQSLVDLLRIVLRESLREDLGGTYGVGVSASPMRDPRPEYRLRITFGSDPARVDELTAAAFAAVDTLASRGPTGEDLEKVKEGQLRQREVDLKDNGFWLSVLDYYDRYGEDLGLILEYDALVEGLNARDLATAVRRYVTHDHYVEVSLLPESDAPSASEEESGESGDGM